PLVSLVLLLPLPKILRNQDCTAHRDGCVISVDVQKVVYFTQQLVQSCRIVTALGDIPSATNGEVALLARKTTLNNPLDFSQGNSSTNMHSIGYFRRSHNLEKKFCVPQCDNQQQGNL
ncbi:MAG TPA: hypothetical protein DEP38_15205, partial [Cyanobacteria bacterium UBA9226]|nr:hypothetical protein [Cyanobacteria bacterium UBA9226]